jgi:SPP1 gp7 family putative phage head morphogenesis protein
MNRNQRTEYWNQWERRRRNVEKRHRGKISKALSNQVKTYIAGIEDKGVTATYLNLDLKRPYENLYEAFKGLYVQAGLFQANVVYGETRRYKYRGFGFNGEWTRLILEYLERYILEKVVLPITDNTKDWIKKVLEKAVTDGWSVDETVREIMTKSRDINAKRARVITRTESVRAMNHGTLVGAEKSRLVMEKVWITARDERVRGSHRRLEGKTADVEDSFPDSVLKFPGDPDGKAKDVVNCRCTIAMMPKRDENGRLIRKPEIRISDRTSIESSLNSIVREAQEFKPAASIKEVEDRLSAYSISKPTMRGVDVEVGNKVLKTIEDIYKGGKLEKLSRISAGKFRNDAMASYGLGTGELKINTNHMGSVKKVNDYMANAVKDKEYLKEKLEAGEIVDYKKRQLVRDLLSYERSLVGDSVEDIITHELGHHIDLTTLVTKQKEFRKEVTANLDNYVKGLSSYAKSDHFEYIAESFTSYRKGENRIDPLLAAFFKSLGL